MKPIKFTWVSKVDSNPEALWKYLSNSDLLNRMMKNPPVEESYSEDQVGRHRIGHFRFLGMNLLWEEFPFEWVQAKWISNHRTFLKGPIGNFHLQMNFNLKDRDRHEIHFLLELTPKSKMLIPLVFLIGRFIIQNRIQDSILKMDKNLTSESNKQTKLFVSGIFTNPNFINKTKIEKSWESISKNTSLKNKLIDWVYRSTDEEKMKIRPYRLADLFGISRKEMLVFFLQGTEEGIFEMSWDILCPECRGGGNKNQKLSGVKKVTHCKSCNISFNAEFDKSVELTFSFHKEFVDLPDGVFCLGSPARTPHILIQKRLQSGENLEIQSSELGSGDYKIYSVDTKKYLQWVNATAMGESLEELEYDFSESKQYDEMKIQKIRLKNNVPEEILIRLENCNWLTGIVTAHEVTAMQEFRDLFSSEVLSTGEEISIRTISILFTDLKGSTKFYRDAGDAYAFSKVMKHFDLVMEIISKHNGAVVKTIGDSVMAVFTSPLSCLKASLMIQSKIHELNHSSDGNQIIIKIGAHSGPVLAVNLNNRLDYFGQTVNIAARAEGQSLGGDIVFTEKMFEFEEIRNHLKEQSIRTESFQASFKGYDEEFHLIRIVPAKS